MITSVLQQLGVNENWSVIDCMSGEEDLSISDSSYIRVKFFGGKRFMNQQTATN